MARLEPHWPQNLYPSGFPAPHVPQAAIGLSVASARPGLRDAPSWAQPPRARVRLLALSRILELDGVTKLGSRR